MMNDNIGVRVNVGLMIHLVLYDERLSSEL